MVLTIASACSLWRTNGASRRIEDGCCLRVRLSGEPVSSRLIRLKRTLQRRAWRGISACFGHLAYLRVCKLFVESAHLGDVDSSSSRKRLALFARLPSNKHLGNGEDGEDFSPQFATEKRLDAAAAREGRMQYALPCQAQRQYS